MKNLEELSIWASRLSLVQIRNLPEDELLNMVMERPSHPGQYGFMFPRARFVSGGNFATIFCELMKRLGKVDSLKEKMQERRRCWRV